MKKYPHNHALALSIKDATRPALRYQDEQSFLESPYGFMFLTLMAVFVGFVLGALI